MGKVSNDVKFQPTKRNGGNEKKEDRTEGNGFCSLKEAKMQHEYRQMLTSDIVTFLQPPKK